MLHLIVTTVIVSVSQIALQTAGVDQISMNGLNQELDYSFGFRKLLKSRQTSIQIRGPAILLCYTSRDRSENYL